MNIILPSEQKFTVDRMTVRSSKPRVVEFSFGDGYTQRALKGLNPLDETFNLTFTNRPKEEIEFLIEFFETKAGVDAFGFSPPGSPSIKLTGNFFSDYVVRTAGDSISTIGTPEYILVNSIVNAGFYKVDRNNSSGNSIYIYGTNFSPYNSQEINLYSAVGVICPEWEVTYVQPTVYTITCTLIRAYNP
jgi:phage-related protein